MVKKRTPVLDKDWLPDSGYGNQPTHIAVDMLADSLIQLDAETAGAARSLQEQLAGQAREIAQLRATVSALAELLLEQQLVAGDDLRRRTDGKLAELIRPEPPPPQAHGVGGGPYRGGPAAPVAGPVRETCLRCNQQVPASDTHITEAGLVCDRCWNAQSID